MTIDREDQLDGLKHIGSIVARALEAMRPAAEPGMTTAELDAIGAEFLAARRSLRPEVDLQLPRRHLHQRLPRDRPRHPEQDGPEARPLINIDVSG